MNENEFFEIAYAAASSRLCLFTGTGFSKAVTDNEAPSWQSLLESICDITPKTKELKATLFPTNNKNPLSLEEAAQVISIELSKQAKSIHQEIAFKIQALKPKGDNIAIADFLTKKSFNVVTTNYDKLLEILVGEADCLSLTPGLPIPRSDARVNVYHVHGSTDVPKNMVVTSDDYFKFINGESYFSRKLSTVLHENTVVILGYSLSDTNLKAIISDYKGFSRSHVIGSNIFLVSRTKVDQYIKDYYAHCYGIRVLDQIEVHDFFKSLNQKMPNAEQRFRRSIENIREVVYNNKSFKKNYLEIENSFFEIISSLAAIGESIKNERVVKVLGHIIKTKINLTREDGAWVQYEQLARWLVYLASVLDLKATSIESVYLEATYHSMINMKKALYYGYSWQAYKEWNNRWSGILASNRTLIQTYIEEKTDWPDALAVVRSC